MTRVAIIGPGRVGGAVALGLRHAGYQITAVAARSASTTPPSASLEAFTGLVPEAQVLPLTQASCDADLVILATPDDTLRSVAGQIALADAVGAGQRWVHLAGAHGPEILAPVTAAGGRVAACHPAMTFPDPQTGHERLPGASWALTASEDDLGWARSLVQDLGGEPVTIAAANRRLYHAGLSVGSNGSTAVVTLARDLLLGAGIGDPAAFLAPLVAASAHNGATLGVQALTGPIRRGDDATVRGHLAELATSFPDALESYVALGRLILGQAARAGLPSDRVAAVRVVLDSVST